MICRFVSLLILTSTLTTLATSVTNPTFNQQTYASRADSTAPGGAKADLNNDGISDLVLCCDASGNAWYQLAGGDGSFAHPVTIGPAAFPGKVVATGDFNNDGNDDVLLINPSRGITIYYNSGGGVFTSTSYFPSANAIQVVVADFNHDGNLDIAYMPNAATPVQVFLSRGDGKGGFSTPTAIFTSTALDTIGWDLVTGDFDGDRNADLAFTITPCFRGGCNPTTVYALYGDGAGKFVAQWWDFSSQLLIVAADVNQDGRSDLAISSFCPDGSCSNSMGALFGNSNRTFTEAVTPAAPSQEDPLAVADLNGDLKNDLVDSYGVLNTMGAYLALATSSTSWSKQVEVPLSDTGGVSQLVFTGNFNADRKPDVVVYQAESGLLQVLANTTQSGKYGTCAYPAAGQGIHVCSPGAGKTVASPVRFRTAATSFQPIRKTELWIDGQKVTEQYRSWLDFSVALSSGPHTVGIFVNNFDDDHQHTSFSITVK